MMSEGERGKTIEYVSADVPTVSHRIDDTMELLKDFEGKIVGVVLASDDLRNH